MYLGEHTNNFIKKNNIKLDKEIEELVYALNDTNILKTFYSCEGHFALGGNSFCHHNQKAQVCFYVEDIHKVTILCNEILEKVIFDELEVTVKQFAIPSEDSLEIQWELNYRPKKFWQIVPQDEGMYITVHPNWSEKKARDLLRQAFNKTIQVCKTGEWRNAKIDVSKVDN